jgi:hypothetical protein
LPIRPTPARFRPHVEALEDRCVPSTLTVTNAGDGGAGSLRYEIAQAQSGDTIVFNFVSVGKHGKIVSYNNYPQTITLSSGNELYIDKNLTIQGPGAGMLTISSDLATTYNSRIFDVASGATLALSGMTLDHGGGYASNLWLDGWTWHRYDDYGGAILNFGTLTITGCTLSNNSAVQPPDSATYGYPLAAGGAIYNGGVLTVSGCTLSNNSADLGGGIYNAGTTTINGCTFTGNSAGDGGGIYNYNYQASSLTVLDSIFSGNSSAANLYGQNISGAYTDGGGNTFN